MSPPSLPSHSFPIQEKLNAKSNLILGQSHQPNPGKTKYGMIRPSLINHILGNLQAIQITGC